MPRESIVFSVKSVLLTNNSCSPQWRCLPANFPAPLVPGGWGGGRPVISPHRTLWSIQQVAQESPALPTLQEASRLLERTQRVKSARMWSSVRHSSRGSIEKLLHPSWGVGGMELWTRSTFYLHEPRDCWGPEVHTCWHESHNEANSRGCNSHSPG